MPSVDDERVQELLKRVNQIDMDVVFAPRKEPLVPPRYRLMTRKQLNEVLTVTFLAYYHHLGTWDHAW